MGIVFGAMDIVATEAGYAMHVHRAGNKIVALHAVSMSGAIGKIRRIGPGRTAFVEFPELAEVEPRPEAHRPGEVFAVDRIAGRIADGVALNAHVVGFD